jgi:hypothetical protein
MLSGTKDVVKIEVCFYGAGAITGLEYYDCIPAENESASEDAPFTTDSFSTKVSDLRGRQWLQDSLLGSNPTSQPSVPGITTFIVIVTIAASMIFLISRFWQYCHK